MASKGSAKDHQSDSIWIRPDPGENRLRLSRALIAATAIEIADKEGFAAVSMRRVAGQLGSATMSLYKYINTKEELVSLMVDEAVGEMLVSGSELPPQWREALAAIARHSREAMDRHPWVVDVLRTRTELGPNGMKHLEQSLKAVSSLSLTAARQIEIISLVDDYVLSFVTRDLLMKAGQEAFANQDESESAGEDYVDIQLRSGAFPHMSKVFGTGEAAWKIWVDVYLDEGRFERGLTALLDGIALQLKP